MWSVHGFHITHIRFDRVHYLHLSLNLVPFSRGTYLSSAIRNRCLAQCPAFQN
ncbi:hypothetical protein R69776_03006 [Paraburkholderia nemoris]|uniref:Uncharacterized protein n=1 Tax=Paraburkholderia nemoris TaxID=2793076 RepID=A0ABN7LLN6_9BURK|nr:hypothetical protein R69776_03006 [Paraburkholderia nemoris]CAE6830390.1 hypothetical protein R75777_06572 [Paraburkholderia nemoris]